MVTGKPQFETVKLGDFVFMVYPYGAVIVNRAKGHEIEREPPHHISRHDLEKYRFVIEKAIENRDVWRKANGKD